MTESLISVIRCPFCHSRLIETGDKLDFQCTGCSKGFQKTPILNLCREELESEKKKVVDFFSHISDTLGETPFNRFVVFQNWGYSGETQECRLFIPRTSSNYNSQLLLGEMIGTYSLNDKAILDVGCGRGGTVRFINKFFTPKMVIGMDITEASLLFCRKQIRNAVFIKADAENIPFQTNSFDALFSIESVSDYPHPNLFYQHAYRILKKDGILFYADIFNSQEITSHENELISLGFHIEQKRDITSNVQKSISETAKNNTATYETTTILNEQPFLDTMGLPGTEIFGLMGKGEKKYMLYRLIKL